MKPSDEGKVREHLLPGDIRPAQVQLHTRQPARKRPRGPVPANGGDNVDASVHPDRIGPGNATEADTALENVLSALRRYKGESTPYSEYYGVHNWPITHAHLSSIAKEGHYYGLHLSQTGLRT